MERRTLLLATCFLVAAASPACARSPFAPPECSDGIDNDGDGRTDLADPGCSGPGDDTEGSVAAGDADAEAEADVEDGADADEGGEEDGETAADDGEEEAGEDGGDVEVVEDGDAEAEASCTTGCWDGVACVGGTSVDACGTGGAACRACDDGRDCTGHSCPAGVCVPAPEPDGAACGEVAGGRCVSGACARVWRGEAASDNFGFAVALGSDVDGDTAADSVVGAPSSAAPDGRMYLFSGTSPTPSATWRGAAAHLGTSVATGYDTDGDGFADLLGGGPDAVAGPLTAAGMVRLVRGGTPPDAPLDYFGTTEYGLFGTAVALGPHAGGGTGADFLVGLPGWDPTGSAPSTGRVVLYDGAAGTVLDTWDGTLSGEHFGAAVALGPDVDDPADGRGDLLVGAPTSGLEDTSTPRSMAGRVRLYSSAWHTPTWTLLGPQPNCALGTSVALGPDLSGDGRADAVVGAPGCVSDQGSVFVCNGVTGALVWAAALRGESTGDRFGLAVSLGPDATGDGVPDLLVGAPARDGARGRVYLVSGADGSTKRMFTGESLGDQLGCSVSLGPDVDGDGLGDILAGACWADDAAHGAAAGKAYLFVSAGW